MRLAKFTSGVFEGAWRGAGWWAVIFAVCGVTTAQPGQPGLRLVEEQFDDVSPLSNSLRVQQRDPRRPVDFDRVYRVDGNLRLFGGGQRFVRIDSGIVAVFSRSEYTPVKQGVLRADIPAGTVFYLGDVRSILSDDSSEAYRPGILAVDLSAAGLTQEALGPRERPSVSNMETPTVFSNEAYRVYRVGQLLDRAAAGR